MKKKLLILITILVLLGTVSFAKVSFLSSRTTVSYSISDTPEAKEIMKAIENAYDIEAEAAYTFDLKKFPDVFINDPRFPLPDSTLQTVREMTNNLSLETAGYLDYKMAYYSWGSNAILQFEEIQQKAKSENRALTDEEKRSVMDQYGRIAPARANSPKRKIPIMFISIEIANDIATVVIDDGPRTVELSLVLVNKKWYIAAYKGLSIHP